MKISTIILGTCIGLLGSVQVPLGFSQDHVLNHTTRIATRVERMHDAADAQSMGLPQGYTGRGVLVGVYDTGIDFGHANFRSPDDGQTRISLAVLYRDVEGPADSIREAYIDPALIDTLTTDNPASWHGTHTAGVAVSSDNAFGLRGMAPEATLALCGSAMLERDRMEDALRSIFAHADEQGMPCVVNVSVGNAIGWKDGKSPLNQLCDSLTDGGNAPGRIIVFAAGNDGAKDFTLQHTFQSNSAPVYTMLQAPLKDGAPEYRNFGFETFSSDSLPLSMSLVAYDTLQHREVDYQLLNLRGDTLTPVMLCRDTAYYEDSLCVDHDLRRYICFGVEDTCRLQTADPQHTVLAARFYGQRGTSFTSYYVMDSNIGLYTCTDGNQPGWLRASSEQSISEFCCTESVISVGAYNGGVDSLVNILGNTLYPISPNGQVADFSSYGITDYGVTKPDVLAPGVSVISGFSSFCDDKLDYYTSGRNPKSPLICQQLSPYDEERCHYWAADVGTSQSAPAVAGIIALWLQADPTLTTHQVRQLLRQTSVIDDRWLATTDPRRYGLGRIDALAGMCQLLGIASVDLFPTTQTSAVFDLYGRRVQGSPSQLHGLYVVGGKLIYCR